MVWALLVVYGALVGADLVRALRRSNPGGLRGFLRDTTRAIQGRVQSQFGTRLSLQGLLADIALSNAASRERLGVRGGGGGGHHPAGVGARGRGRGVPHAAEGPLGQGEDGGEAGQGAGGHGEAVGAARDAPKEVDLVR